MTNPYAPADLIASKSPAFIFSDRFLPSASADSQIGPTISYAVLSLPSAFFDGDNFLPSSVQSRSDQIVHSAINYRKIFFFMIF